MDTNNTHIFYTDNTIMKEMGLSRFTLSSLETYCESYGKNVENIDFITDGSDTPNGSGLKNAILGIGRPFGTYPSILAWNPESKNYKHRPITDYKFLGSSILNPIKTIIDCNNMFLKTKYKHERDDLNYYSGVPFTHEKNLKFINQINTSSSGCVTFSPNLKYIVGNRQHEFSPLIELHLRDPEQQLDSTNQMGIKTPMISDIPQTKGGTDYGYAVTDYYVKDDGPTSIRPPVNGGLDNLDNKVAGYLDTYFNENTGMFECGSRIALVKLLADLPGVVSPPVDIEAIDSSSSLDFYGSDAEQNQAANFDSTIHIVDALCLYVHNGNKSFFGPMFIDKVNDTNKKEIISVTNRTESSFFANETVFVVSIDGEWVPLKLGAGSGGGAASFKIENWSFTKLIANSDSYFRDERFYEARKNPSNIIPDYAKTVLSSNDYTQRIRNRYYKDSTLWPLNTFPDKTYNSETEARNDPDIDTWNNNTQNHDISPSVRYVQSTIFDQVGRFMGGLSDKNLIARCNFDSPPDGSENNPESFDDPDFLGFWGPQFIDGYKSNEVKNLLSKKGSLIISHSGSNSDKFFSTFRSSIGNPAITDVGYGDRNVSLMYKSPKGMFGDASDTIAKNLPAEIATNSPLIPKGMGSPVYDINRLANYFNTRGSNLHIAINRFLSTPRTCWLHQQGENLLPVYNLTPINPAKIDFFSLTAEMVSSTDYEGIGDSQNNRNHGNFKLMNKFFQRPIYGKHMFGGDHFFNRQPYNHLFSAKFHLFGQTQATGGTIKTIKYDKYVLGKSTGEAGSLRRLSNVWEDDTADVIGVISSKCTIKISRSNQIKLSCTQQFGLPLDRWFFMLGGNGGPPQHRRDPRWGNVSSSNNRPQDFNTTALHVKVYDAWPQEQTIYDSRYFAVFHFNPGNTIDGVFVSETPVSGTSIFPDIITMSSDFREPTLLNNSLMSLGTFTSSTSMALPQHWRVNSSSRAKMLTLGGYRHVRKVSGVDPTSVNLSIGGQNYIVGDKLTGSGGGKNIKAEVSSIGAGGTITSIIVTDKGTNLLASELINLTLVGGSGSGSSIKFSSGLVYEKIYTDIGPQERVTTTLLTDHTNQGNGNKTPNDGLVAGVKETILEIREPNTSGRYDMFFHYHNDITHTTQSFSQFFMCKVQRVLLEISVQ